jgi:hypothetical protein
MKHRTGPMNRQNPHVSSDVRWSDKRDLYIKDHPMLLCIAISAVLGGLAFVIFPEILRRSALGVLPGGMERVWGLIFMIGGGLVINGVRTIDARFEVPGLMILAGTYFSYSYAVFSFRGFTPGLASMSVFIGLGLGSTLRACVLYFEPNWKTPWRSRRPASIATNGDLRAIQDDAGCDH